MCSRISQAFSVFGYEDLLFLPVFKQAGFACLGGKPAEASKALLSFVVPKEVYDLRHAESEPLTSEDVCW